MYVLSLVLICRSPWPNPFPGILLWWSLRPHYSKLNCPDWFDRGRLRVYQALVPSTVGQCSFCACLWWQCCMQCLGGFCLPCAHTVWGMAWSDEFEKYRTVWERERVVKERPSRGRKYFHLQQRMHSFVFSAPPVLLFNWNLTRSILKNASIFPVCFYCMIPGVQSWSLHLQQLTLFTSSPWQTKSCWLPPCHLLQLCVQTLTQQWCWHCGFSRPFVTMSQGSQAVCFHFWLLQTFLRVKRSRSASFISASGALVEGLSAEDQESKQSLKEVLLPICKAELELAKVSQLLAAWFSSSLVKGKEAELDYPKREAGRVN